MISQLVQNGELVGNTTAASESLTGAKVKSSMNETKEMFLQLLVAEMQYQDPLEPTDNSEYVKELATFSQVETLNNVQDDITKLTSQALVGKYVSLTDEDTGGIVEGKVDYVTENAGEQYISVEGKLFKASAVTSVHDDDYFESVTMADSFSNLVNQMPNEKELTAADEEKLGILNTIYGGMTDSQKSFVTDDVMNKYNRINERMSELLAQKEMTNSSETAAQMAAAQMTDDTAEDNADETDDEKEASDAADGGSSAALDTDTGAAGDDEPIGTTIA